MNAHEVQILHLLTKSIAFMASLHTDAFVKNSTTEGICTITFYHPQSNSLPASLLLQLADEISAAGNNAKCNVVILQSAGEKAFCAGASFTELLDINDAEAGFHFFSGFAKVINAMRCCPKLIIGRIHGKCVGGGVGLTAACDYAIACKEADVKLSELAVGIGPFVVGPAVERKIGNAAFTALAIDAQNWRSSEWAASKGLFAELHADKLSMDAAITKLANQLAVSSPEAMQRIKMITWQGTEHWDDFLMERASISGQLVFSDFTRRFIADFKAKKLQG